MSLTCELCGSTSFVKDEGVFVCQDCGCKYTLEEARNIMAQAKAAAEREARRARRNDPDARVEHLAPEAAAPVVQAGAYADAVAANQPIIDVMGYAGGTQVPTLHSGADFSQAIAMGLHGAHAINNYACQGWRLLLDEYNRLDHPSKQRQEQLGERAREVLMLLDNAVRIDPENHLQNLLILDNCKEVVSQAHQTAHYEKDEEGKLRRRAFTLDVKLPGQSSSWDELIKFHKGFLQDHYRNNHPDEVSEREALVAQRKSLEAKLDELKDEKRSKGFFNFSEKREVKDRMKPYQEELKQVNRQIGALDDKIEDYIDRRVAELGSGYVRL